jgi:hypothetical protein
MVREMYRSLGFTLLLEDASGQSRWCLPLSGFVSRAVPMQVDAVVAEALVS